jgi:hypothetical protein
MMGMIDVALCAAAIAEFKIATMTSGRSAIRSLKIEGKRSSCSSAARWSMTRFLPSILAQLLQSPAKDVIHSEGHSVVVFSGINMCYAPDPVGLLLRRSDPWPPKDGAANDPNEVAPQH